MIFDAHLDLAMNALDWNRDLRRPLAEIRERERHLLDRPDRGRNTVCFPELRKGGVGVCVATQIARYVIAIGQQWKGLPAIVHYDQTHAAVFINHQLVRALALDPTRRYQPSGKPPGRRPKPKLNCQE